MAKLYDTSLLFFVNSNFIRITVFFNNKAYRIAWLSILDLHGSAISLRAGKMSNTAHLLMLQNLHPEIHMDPKERGLQNVTTPAHMHTLFVPG